MTEITRLQQILIQLRGAIASQTQRNATATRTTSTKAQEGQVPNLRSALTAEVVATLKGGLAGLDLQLEKDRAKARRLLIESILLGEFGTEIANDSRFLALLERVDDAIAADTDICREMDQFLAQSKA